MTKRLLAAVLSVVMVVSMMVFPTYAQEETAAAAEVGYCQHCKQMIPEDKWLPWDELNLGPRTGHYYLAEDIADQAKQITINLDDDLLRNEICLDLRGRTYTAWYAHDIPIGDGPWKFHGLPGLILKVNDKAKDYYWTCTALYQPQWESPISIKKQARKTTYKKYHKAKKRAEEDPNALHANDPNAKIRTPNGEWVLASELNKGKYRPPYTPKELDW